eukprot:10187158-Alexandrium_andersonii.AAC.1
MPHPGQLHAGGPLRRMRGGGWGSQMSQRYPPHRGRAPRAGRRAGGSRHAPHPDQDAAAPAT